MATQMKEPVVLYGIGQVGEKLLPFIENQYQILCCFDANSRLWGTKWFGKNVYPPALLAQYQGKVIITTREAFFDEISNYLLCLGLRKEQIFYGHQLGCEQKAELVPFPIEDNLSSALLKTGLPNNRLTVMIFCAFYSVYATHLIINMKRRFPEIVFSILSGTDSYAKELVGYIEESYVYHSYVELGNILRGLSEFDVFQFLWIENIWVYYRKLLRLKCRRMNLCIGGSDFYRSDELDRSYKKHLIDLADVVSGETDTTIEDFLQVYPQVRPKMRWVNFGLDVIDEIDKIENKDLISYREIINIPEGKLIVTCGHNGRKEHQHNRIVQVLRQLPSAILDKSVFVFPMTYPANNEPYISEIKNQLEDAKLDYRILTAFMNETEMACYSSLSDIMIHVQTTDQLSSTMLEEIYAGTVVVTGSWLPYAMLKKDGIYFEEIKDFCDLTNILTKIIEEIDYYKFKCSSNRELIRRMSSWDAASVRWNNLWSL